MIVKSSMETQEVTREQVIELLKTVFDPELFIDVWTLGLIYHIEIDENKISIRMTFTSVACPAGPQLVGDVQDKLKTLPGIETVDVEVVFEPPWEPSEELKGMMGIL